MRGVQKRTKSKLRQRFSRKCAAIDSQNCLCSLAILASLTAYAREKLTRLHAVTAWQVVESVKLRGSRARLRSRVLRANGRNTA